LSNDTATKNTVKNTLLASVIRRLDQLVLAPRSFKRVVVFSFDAVLCMIAIWLSFSLRLGEWDLWNDSIGRVVIAAFLLWPPIFILLGIYKSIVRFAGSGTMIELMRAVSCFAAAMIAIFTFYGVAGVPRTIGFLIPILFFMLLAVSRIVGRYVLFDLLGRNAYGGDTKRVLIYGAGGAGQQLALSIRHYPGMLLCGFVDDDKRLHGQKLDGIPVYHADQMGPVVEKLRITDILLALPTINRARRKKIIGDLQQYKAHVQTLPQLQDIVSGKVTIGDLQEVEIDDLLGRDAVAPNDLLMGRTIVGKTVLVTGAGGSIGSELCRQILAIGPKKLILAEMTEHALYTIEQELTERMRDGLGKPDIEIIPELSNTASRRPVRSLFAKYRPDTVFHAAAYKHVPLVEHNPVAGIGNNVLSALNTALEARATGVSHYILISTDKAVRPTNIMGASKRVCELILQALAKDAGKTGAKTKFSMVRFGNVLGSSGSVVPRFKEQIAKGGPVTLTHRKITRYFMTIPEAAQLVIQAGAMAQGGEVFVLDMGKSVKIYDLARTMIQLSGLTVRDEKNPDGDIVIQEVGLRPGEKLYEELLIGENPKETKHKRIMQAREKYMLWAELEPRLEALRGYIDTGDRSNAIMLLRELVPEYQPAPANDIDERESA
jgi:FlaA1/EpsC-like NDP-sugar epimerase